MAIVSPADVRAAFLLRQGLGGNPACESVHKAVGHIGAVQIDTIAVVSRSHHLTMRHRVCGYDPEQLWNSLRQRQLFEYYVHGNCLVPVGDFPFIRHCMKRFPTHGYRWLRGAIPKYKDIMETVLKRIRDEGPLTSRDFEDPKHRSSGWWDWKPAKNALELLWWMGQIAVVNRIGFDRCYDIAERAIPTKHLDQNVDIDEVWRHFLPRTIDCLAVATVDDIRDYYAFHVYSLDKKQSVKKTLDEKVQILLEEDVIAKVEVQGDSTPHYALRSNLSLVEEVQNRVAEPDHAWFLGPFDNIVWDRKRVRRLFRVDVKLEAYTSAAKRQFGYYTMYILWNDRIVGRFDPKLDRKTNTLVFANLELELLKNEKERALEAIREELARFMAFHDCERLQIERARPAQLKSQLL